MAWVSGDTGPAISARIPLLDNADEETGSYVDLTGATVKFQMRRPDDKNYRINQAATVVGDPTNGNVSYSWSANDLAVPGDYEVQWEVTLADTTIQTTKKVTITVLRQ